MYLEASEHACPHLREQRAAEAKPAATPSRDTGCPFSAARSQAEPHRVASAGTSAGGWWAFAAEARAMTASA